MPPIAIKNKTFLPEMVVFDKDGTLIDFNQLWGGLVEECIEALAAGLPDSALAERSYRALGYDKAAKKTASNSPLAVAPLSHIGEIILSELLDAGVTPAEARELVETHLLPCLKKTPSKELLFPLGDVSGLFESLKAGGIRIGIVTSDDRPATEQALAAMRVSHLVDNLVCADDPFSHKPSPEAIQYFCELYDMHPSRVVVVGDNPSDLEMGRRAGAGLTVGVLSGNSGYHDLEPVADMIIENIDQIKVL